MTREEIKILDTVYHVYCSGFLTYDIEEMYVMGAKVFSRDGKNVEVDLQSTIFPERKIMDSAESIFKTMDEAKERAKELQRACVHRIITEEEYQEFMQWKLSKSKKQN